MTSEVSNSLRNTSGSDLKTKHTPGPWKVEAIPAEAYTDPDLSIPADSRFWIVEEREGGEVLATVDINSHHNEEAIAQVFAASWELLAELKAAQEELRLIRMKDCAVVYDPALNTRMAAVIAKAEGRLP